MRASGDAESGKNGSLFTQMFAASSKRSSESAAAKAVQYRENLEWRVECLEELYIRVSRLRMWCDDIPEEDYDLVEAFITPLAKAIQERRGEVAEEESRIAKLDREFEEGSWRDSV